MAVTTNPETTLSTPKNARSTSFTRLELEGLLSGDLHLPDLSRISLSQVTKDVRLNNIYDRANVNNLAEFLKFGKDRFSLSGYGKGSEKKLKESLFHFLTQPKSESFNIRQRAGLAYEPSTQPLQVSLNFDFDKVLSSKTPEKLINSSVWQAWILRMIDLGYTDEPIFFVCQEIGERWPVKNGWQDRTFEDFCSDSFKDLLSGKNFGKVKLRSLIKAVAYLLSGGREHLSEKTPKEKLIWLKQTTNLNKREQEIFERRSKGETLDEIGRSMNVTRERIRQIQKDILLKYRSPKGLQICSEYLNQRQQAIWHKVAKGKLYLPQSTPLTIEGLGLDEYDCFAIFVYTGERVKSERFSEMVAEFFNNRFKQAGGCWFDLPHDESDVAATIALVRSTVARITTPIAMRELANHLPNISHELLTTAVQLTERVNSYCGYIVHGRLTPRKRRTIGVHIALSELEQSISIVSISALLKAYRAAFGFDQCSERDVEIVMVESPHLFFKLGQEGWVSTGMPGRLSAGFHVSNSSVEEEDEYNGGEASEKVRQIADALDIIGISHVTELNAQLIKEGAHIPMTSLQPMLYSYEPFSRFAPGFYGLKKHLDDIYAVARARAKLTSNIVSPRIPIFQLRSYVFARYAGESRDVYLLWGTELEALWAEILYDKENDELIESFWNIVVPDDIADDADTLKRYEERKSLCAYRLNTAIPEIEDEPRIDLDELLASLIYLKHSGRISCARSNILMGRRIDGQHSISLLATLVLLGAIRPEEDWRKEHSQCSETDPLIKMLKDAYAHRVGETLVANYRCKLRDDSTWLDR